MCKVSELLTTQNPKKSSLNKNLLYTGFPISQEKSTIFDRSTFLTISTNFFCQIASYLTLHVKKFGSYQPRSLGDKKL